MVSIGKPFRQSMRHNLPFVVTMALALGVSSYMLFDPAPWLVDFMKLTWMSPRFRVFLLVLALASFIVCYLAERQVLPRLARWLGKAIQKWGRSKKKRKEYKIILEGMRI